MNKKLAAAMVALLTLGMTTSVAAQELEDGNNVTASADDERLNESSNITVSVSSKTAIDVKPNNLTFSGLNIGTQTVEETSGESPRFGSFTLENIGSEYIDRVWASASAPSSDPFGTGNPQAYDAGNFLQIKPSDATPTAVRGDDSVYHYINRYEYANSWDSSQGEIPSYIRASPSEVIGGTAQDSYVGRLQAGDEWYFYTIATGSSNDVCDGSGNAVLRIGNTRHSSSQFGSVDFRSSSSDYQELSLQQTDGSYGLTTNSVDLNYTVSGSDVTRTYDLLTKCSGGDPHVIRSRYNVQAGDVSDLTVGDGSGDNAGSQSQFLFNTDSAGQMLLPGGQLIYDVAIEVPQGVSEGSVQDGSLTFFVTSDDSAQQ